MLSTIFNQFEHTVPFNGEVICVNHLHPTEVKLLTEWLSLREPSFSRHSGDLLYLPRVAIVTKQRNKFNPAHFSFGQHGSAAGSVCPWHLQGSILGPLNVYIEFYVGICRFPPRAFFSSLSLIKQGMLVYMMHFIISSVHQFVIHLVSTHVWWCPTMQMVLFPEKKNNNKTHTHIKISFNLL